MKKKFEKKDLPLEIPIFPLSNAIFFPKTLLPLNIFEPRYKQMTEHALNGDNFIGMIQSTQKLNSDGKPKTYKVGCLGYIEHHSSTSDGRYLINLKGVSRFKTKKEIVTQNLYRTFEVGYDEYS